MDGRQTAEKGGYKLLQGKVQMQCVLYPSESGFSEKQQPSGGSKQTANNVQLSNFSNAGCALYQQ